ncbi:MAG TPA: nuclear transport factor 2 family protein [Microlunatus sp.]
MNSVDTRTLLQSYHQAMINFSADAFADLYATDAVHEFPFRNPDGVQRLAGREEIRDYYRALWSDPAVILEQIDERATHQPSPSMIINEWHGTGHRRADGAAFQLSGVIVLAADRGMITAVRDYMDVQGLLSQLGSH